MELEIRFNFISLSSYNIHILVLRYHGFRDGFNSLGLRLALMTITKEVQNLQIPI